MYTTVDYQAMTKTQLLEIKSDVNKALEHKKYVTGLDIGKGFAESIKGKKPVITKQLLEQMMNEAAND